VCLMGGVSESRLGGEKSGISRKGRKNRKREEHLGLCERPSSIKNATKGITLQVQMKTFFSRSIILNKGQRLRFGGRWRGGNGT